METIMTHTNKLNAQEAMDAPAFSKRLAVLSFGLLGYASGCFGLFWLILGAGGLAPVGLSAWQATSFAEALLVDIALISLFGLQHSIMARNSFKVWLTRFIPKAAERATFMLMSGVVTCLALYFWQALPGNIWAIENQLAVVLIYGLYAAGTIYLLLSTFVTNHFELMGLRQVYLYFRNIPYTTLPFTNKFMYRYSRHPMMLGMLILLWSVPVMSATRLALSILFTLYIVVGIYFEERDLMKHFGETYKQYKKAIATFIPRIY